MITNAPWFDSTFPYTTLKNLKQNQLYNNWMQNTKHNLTQNYELIHTLLLSNVSLKTNQ